jgi:hypothetical protein
VHHGHNYRARHLDRGGGHGLTHHFAVFGYHVTGSTGALFRYGIVVGALPLFGLSLRLAGARRTSRRGREARRGLTQSRRETAAVSQDRDDLLEQRETARAYTSSTLSNSSAADVCGGPFSKWHLFAPRTTCPQAAGPPAPAVNEDALGDPADAAVAPD